MLGFALIKEFMKKGVDFGSSNFDAGIMETEIQDLVNTNPDIFIERDHFIAFLQIEAYFGLQQRKEESKFINTEALTFFNMEPETFKPILKTIFDVAMAVKQELSVSDPVPYETATVAMRFAP